MPPRRRRARTVFHYKVDHVLRDHPADAVAYDALLSDPRTTVDAAHAWLQSRGHALSRSAVARHRRRHAADTRRRGDAAALAVSLANAAQQSGVSDFTAALLMRHQQLMINHLFYDVQTLDDLGMRDYLDICKSIDHAVSAQRTLLEIDRLRATAPPPAVAPPPNADDAAAPPPTQSKADRDAALRRKIYDILGHDPPPPADGDEG